MKKGVDGCTPYLSEEIIRNILIRLPVKCLIRFQCVCKHWKILFKTSSFIADHLHHSNHQNPCLLFQRKLRFDPSNLYWLDSEMKVGEFQMLDFLKLGKIVGSSNGLLCVEISKHNAYLHFLLVWNPAVREVKLMPETYFHQYCYHHFIGFGFSPIINDYKIVITYVTPYSDTLSGVKVYSLSSGSWKEVRCELNDKVCLNYGSVTVNGVMFWLGSELVGEYRDDDKGLIVSFDLATEVFTVIPIPEEYSISYYISSLTVYEEKLAMVYCFENSEHSVIDLWVMEEGIGASGERWSWTKKYTSGPYPCPYPCRLCPVTIWRNEIVCRAHMEDDCTAVLFNPTTKKVNTFAISKCDNLHHIFNYVESLVVVGGMQSFANLL